MIGFPKPASRLQDRKADQIAADKAERKFKTIVWLRDQAKCRWCDRKVIKSIERIPNRGEVNHIHGRLGELRYEDRAALLLCLEHHECVTGRVAEKWIIEGTRKFLIGKQRYSDARYDVRFKRLA